LLLRPGAFKGCQDSHVVKKEVIIETSCALHAFPDLGEHPLWLRCLVEPPLDLDAASIEIAGDLLEALLADIDVVDGAAHALVLDDGGGSLAVSLDGDGLAAHGVAVGDGAHQEVREGNNVLRLVLAGVVIATSTHADVVVGELASLGGAAAAAAATRATAIVGLLLVGVTAGGRSGRGRGSRSSGLGLRDILLGGDRLRSLIGGNLGLRDLLDLGGGGGRLGGRRGRSVDAGDQSGGRSRLLLSRLLDLGSRLRGGLGLDELGGFRGRGLGLLLAGGDPDGGGRVDHLGNILVLSHPLDLGDDNVTLGVLVVAAVVDAVNLAMGLGNGHSGEEGRGDGEGLHCEFLIVPFSVVVVFEFLIPTKGVVVAVICLLM